MANSAEQGNRFTLPIPDPVHVGLTIYDAKDPDTPPRAGPADGGVRRLSRAHRLPGRPAAGRGDGAGILDDTLTVHIVGDNGASAEGTPRGTTNELLVFNQSSDVETADYLVSTSTRWPKRPDARVS